jgi:hypothetical protein
MAWHFVAPEWMGTVVGTAMGTAMVTENGRGFRCDAKPKRLDRLQQAGWRRLAFTSPAALQV